MAKIGAEFSAGFNDFGRALSDLTRTIRSSISSIEKFSASLGVSTAALNRFATALNRATSALGGSSRSRTSSPSSSSGGAFYAPALRGAATQFNIGGSGSGLWGMIKGFSEGISKAAAALKPLGVIAAAIAVVFMALRKAGEMLSRTFEWIATTARNFAEVYATSRRIGMKVSDTEVLQRAFEGSGGSRSSMNIAIQSMLRQIGRGSPIFKEIGLNTGSLKSMSGLDAFKKVIDALGKIKSASKLEHAITSIFGRGSQNFPVELIRDPKVLKSSEISASKPYKKYLETAGKDWADIALYTSFFKNKWQEFSMGFFSAFDTGLKSLTNSMSQKDVFSTGRDFAEMFKPLIVFLAKGVDFVVSVFTFLAKVIGAVVSAFEGLFDILGTITDGLKYIFDGLTMAIEKIIKWFSGKTTDEQRAEKKAYDEEYAMAEKKTLESGRPNWVKTIELSWLEMSKRWTYSTKGWNKLDEEEKQEAEEARRQRELKKSSFDSGFNDIENPKLQEGGRYSRLENISGGWGSVGGYMNAAQSSMGNNSVIHSEIVKQTALQNQLVTYVNEMLSIFRVQLSKAEAPSYVY